MQGQLAVLIVSSLLVSECGVWGACMLSLCDNLATLRGLSAHSRSLRVRDHFESEVDLFLIHRNWMKKQHVCCTQQWVKGHQDRKKPRHEISAEGLMNIEVDDELANAAYITARMDKTSLDMDVYSDDVYGIFINGLKFTNKVTSRVVDRCVELAMTR